MRKELGDFAAILLLLTLSILVVLHSAPGSPQADSVERRGASAAGRIQLAWRVSKARRKLRRLKLAAAVRRQATEEAALERAEKERIAELYSAEEFAVREKTRLARERLERQLAGIRPVAAAAADAAGVDPFSEQHMNRMVDGFVQLQRESRQSGKKR